MSSKPTALGAHVFAGGFTLGLLDKFEIKAHYEQLKLASEHAIHNFDFPVEIMPEMEDWPLPRGIDFLFGNPPCHGFSAINMTVKTKDRVNYRDNVYMENFVKYSIALRPKVACFEMVCGLMNAGAVLLDRFIKEWNEAGYSTTIVKVAAMNHGIPQLRRRIFVVAHKIKMPDTPAITTPNDVVVADAISDLENQPEGDEPTKYATRAQTPLQRELRRGNRKVHNHVWAESKWDPFLHLLEPGSNLATLPTKILDKHFRGKDKRERGVSPPGSFLFKTSPTRRAGVIGGQPGQFHYLHNRMISVRESARIMGYPDWFEFVGTSLGKKYAGIGKAVSPKVTAWLGEWVHEALNPSRQKRVVTNEFVDRTKG